MNSIQFEENIGQTLGGLILAVGMGLGAVGSAEAGAVSGNFDPPFGPALPGWNYSGTFNLDFSENWVNDYGGDTSFGAFVGTTQFKLILAEFGQTGNLNLNSTVRLCEIAVAPTCAPSSSATSEVLSITYDIASGLLTDWETTTDLGAQTLAELNSINFGAVPGGPRTFNFSWDSLLAGPTLICAGCGLGAGPVNASRDGLIVSYQQVDEPRFFNSGGGLVGSVTSTYTADANGDITRNTVVTLPGAVQNSVPEPGSMALVLAALTGAAWVRRRQA